MVSVFLYVPNLIGYARVLLAIISYYYISTPTIFIPLYILSCLLDALDGHAARLLKQSTYIIPELTFSSLHTFK